MKRGSLWMLCAVCCVLSTGCVTRSLTIKTDPPGAKVYVNDQLKGTSPITYDFLWYGSHRVMVRKEGFQRVDDTALLRSPVWLWIPGDLIAELVPYRFHDDRVLSYALTPAPVLPTPAPPELSNQKVTPVAPSEPVAGPVPEQPAAPTTHEETPNASR